MDINLLHPIGMRETLKISLNQEFGELEKKILPPMVARQDFFIANDNF